MRNARASTIHGGARELAATAAIAAILAAPSTIVTMGFAWERNPGGAIHALGAGDARVIHWAPWLLLGATRFLPVFVSVCAGVALVRALIAHVHDRVRERDRA